MEKAKNNVHPLILSSIFHYEFVFIHPFSDGNGRMARLWHTAILSQWKPIFEYLSESVKKLLEVMEYDIPYSGTKLIEKLGLKSKEGFRRNYLCPAMESNVIRMTIPDKPNSRNQRYVKV